ncbi:protein FAR1-RELATED SEQUENCE 5-like [Lolium perenne]|uniref:protein FAR1-RELATED SEQUENCE 5-like n=1 Tax=Lolium perenne TaxID=4522 RepID=UPI0021F51416|nr:protein FAR1-RELATED SEQUENCE 5-like [Lolium perenne]
MDWFNLHCIDLNHPPGYDDFIEPDGTEAPLQGTSVDDTGANSGFMSVDDTTDGAPTGQTLSSEESGRDGEVQSMLEGFAPRKPYLGMKFDTWEAAKVHYNRKSSIWEVTQFIEEHTHETIKKLGLKKYLRSHKKIPKEEKKFIDLLDSVNLSARRIMDIMSELYGTGKAVPYDTKTISNYMASIDEKQNVKDIPELLNYFEEPKKEDPNFFYKYKLDSEDRVENIFSREVYKNYNDCISFETTYMTNTYKMSCAPIIGINRYGQTIHLGCGFLRNEKISNFVWLFEQFLDAMDGLHPLNIITDQDVAITTAIQEMFPNSCHRNCRWHIMQNAQGSPLGPFMAKHEELQREFNEIVDYSLTPVEFENRWGEMIERHGVSDNTDLAYLYEIRAKFVLAYFMDRFFPFLQTTARSEGFNVVLKRYVDPNASLLRFFKQYMKLQERIDITED